VHGVREYVREPVQQERALVRDGGSPRPDRIVVAEQFSAATLAFDAPDNHLWREAPLTTHVRDALSGLAREGEFCFVSLRGEHWTPSSRAYPWKAVRAAAGWEGSLYLATRHFAGWYMVNELEMSSRTWRSRSAIRTAGISSVASTATATRAALSDGFGEVPEAPRRAGRMRGPFER
jgi:hypothetical protein